MSCAFVGRGDYIRCRGGRWWWHPREAVERSAHPIRLHILSVAESEDISASEVAVALSEPLGVVAYHFRVLHTAGLIELVGTERRRGSIQSYRATTTGWAALAETVEQMIGE